MMMLYISENLAHSSDLYFFLNLCFWGSVPTSETSNGVHSFSTIISRLVPEQSQALKTPWVTSADCLFLESLLVCLFVFKLNTHTIWWPKEEEVVPWKANAPQMRRNWRAENSASSQLLEKPACSVLPIILHIFSSKKNQTRANIFL